ncbi:MAG: hypothetical protein ACLTHP_11915 [Lachnospiraceae bacterium]
MYLHWLENIKDWCISVRSGGDIGFRLTTVMSAVNLLWQERCRKNAALWMHTFHWDEDTLDTWFSSTVAVLHTWLAGQDRRIWIISIRQMYL